MLISTVNDVWYLIFHIVRCLYFVCRGAMKEIIASDVEGWGWSDRGLIRVVWERW